MSPKTLLFIKKSNSKFVTRDEKILMGKYSVKSFKFGDKSGLAIFPNFLEILIWLLKNIWKSDIIFSWFCDYHSLLPVIFGKIFNKKIVIVIGGFDAAKVDPISYGAHQDRFRSFIIGKCSNLATILLPVSKNTERELFQNTNIRDKEKSKVIYNGVNTNNFKNIKNINKTNSVITVSGINETSIKRKGLRLFVKAAEYFPDNKFYLIGNHKPGALSLLGDQLPKNLIITGRVSDARLAELMYQAKVYVQASVHEGFGVSMAEAMYCQCIPVVSKRTAIPEVVGDTGYYLDSLTVNELVDKIRFGLNDKNGRKARQRIIDNYTLKIRRKNLLKILKLLDRSK